MAADRRRGPTQKEEQKMAVVPISTRTIVQRINRKLAHGGQSLSKARGRNAAEFGWHIVHGNTMVRWGLDPVELAKELGVLKPYERVER